MKILVLNNMIPFVRGGADQLASNLVRHLRRYGHDAELMRIPFRWDPVERLYDEMLACRMMRLNNVDRVIGLKFPAYLIPHPHKTLWLIQQFRQTFDLTESPTSDLPNDQLDDNLRKTITAADRECLSQSENIFVISRAGQRRLSTFNGYEGHVLHPPLDDSELFNPGPESNYIFCGGRVNSRNRQHLLVEAMTHVRSDVQLIIAGRPETVEDAQRLESLIAKHKLQDRIRLQLGLHPRDQLVKWVNGSLACAYVPFDEDYGYVTLEAFYSGKSVVTTEDAGSVLSFVRDRETGLVASPNAQSLAVAIDEIRTNPESRRHWGAAALSHIHEQNITWPETVKRLVA